MNYSEILLELEPLSNYDIEDKDLSSIFDFLLEYYNDMSDEDYQTEFPYILWICFITHFLKRPNYLHDFFISEAKPAVFFKNTKHKDLKVTHFFSHLRNLTFADSLMSICENLKIQMNPYVVVGKRVIYNFDRLRFYDTSVYMLNLWKLVNDHEYYNKDGNIEFKLYVKLASSSIISWVRDDDKFRDMRNVLLRISYSYNSNIKSVDYNDQDFIEYYSKNILYKKTESIFDKNEVTFDKYITDE